jgi:hypothetical protein
MVHIFSHQAAGKSTRAINNNVKFALCFGHAHIGLPKVPFSIEGEFRAAHGASKDKTHFPLFIWARFDRLCA